MDRTCFGRVLHKKSPLILKALQLATRCRNFLLIGIPPRLVEFSGGKPCSETASAFGSIW